LSNHYYKIGNSNLAYDNLNKAYSLKDSIFNDSKIQLAQILNVRYETKQKEQQIKLLTTQKQKQKLITLVIVLSTLIIVIIAIFFFVRFKKKQQLQLEQKLIVQKETERIRIAGDMHDDIGAGLTRIVTRSEQIKIHLQSGKELKNGVVESLEKMASESRELSQNIGEIIWALNPKNDTLDSLFAYIRNYIYDYLDEANIECEIEFPENISDSSVSTELRRNIFLIIKEALNNIVKYANATQTKITLHISENNFSLVIHDNGIGIANLTQLNGNGLENMKKRTEVMGGNFIIENNDGLCLKIENINFKNQTKV
jgi:two-component system, NarL family, sensor histidine kinase UhpB